MKKFIVLGLAALSVGSIILLCSPKFRSKNNNVPSIVKIYITEEEMMLGKPFSYTVEENLDASGLKEIYDEIILFNATPKDAPNPTYPAISGLPDETLKSLVIYMQINNLHVVPGEYELHSAAGFEDGEFILYSMDEQGFFYFKEEIFIFERNK